MIQGSSSDCKIKVLAEADSSSRAIARKLGMNHRYVQQRLKALGIKAGSSGDRPHLSDLTAKLRIVLGDILTELANSRKNISELTGLNKREIHNAMNRPWQHDWTLSQIERTLAHDSRKRKLHEII